MIKTRVKVLATACLLLRLGAAGQDTAAIHSAEQFNLHYGFLAPNVISQPFLDIKNYSLLEGGYRVTGGGYRLAQDADRRNDIFFATQGTRQVKKFLASGRFAYERALHDSIGYTLRYDLNGAAPYYFYSVKKGHWESGRYDLQGIVSRKWLQERLTAGAGISYNAVNAWRSDDPRPEYFDHSMDIGLTVHYRVLPKHTIGLAGSYYKRNTETSVEYRNSNFSTGPEQYPQYITYIQIGYGKQKNQSTRRILRSRTGGWQGSAIYKGDFSFGEVVLTGSLRQQDSRYYLPGTSTGEVPLTYGYFYEEIAAAGLLWKYRRGAHAISLAAQYINHSGEDLNTELSSNNYLYAFEQVSIQPLYSHFRGGRLQYEAGIEAAVSDLFRADGAANVFTDYQVARAMLKGAYYWYPGKDRLLRAGLSGGMQLPISSDVRTPNQVSDFIRGAVFADAYYYRARSYTIQADMMFVFPVKTLKGFVRGKGARQQAGLQPSDIPADVLPGKERWWWQASIGVIL